MNLGLQVLYFSIGIALASAGGGAVALMATQYFSLEDLGQAAPYIGLYALLFASLCMLTSWVGFALARSLHRYPSRRHCVALGCIFAVIPVGVVSFVDSQFLHAFASFIIAALIVVAAPLVAFLGSFFVKPTDFR